jgi:hypothetical protein
MMFFFACAKRTKNTLLKRRSGLQTPSVVKLSLGFGESSPQVRLVLPASYDCCD